MTPQDFNRLRGRVYGVLCIVLSIIAVALLAARLASDEDDASEDRPAPEQTLSAADR